jgi:hypothetical protein
MSVIPRFKTCQKLNTAVGLDGFFFFERISISHFNTMSDVTEQPSSMTHSSPGKLPPHDRGWTQANFLLKLDEMKQHLEIESEHSLVWGIAWFPQGRIAVDTKKLGPTLGRKLTVIRANFREANYKFQHMNRTLSAEFRQRFPQVTAKEAYAWSWRIPVATLDAPQVETTKVVNSEDMVQFEFSDDDFVDDEYFY